MDSEADTYELRASSPSGEDQEQTRKRRASTEPEEEDERPRKRMRFAHIWPSTGDLPASIKLALHAIRARYTIKQIREILETDNIEISAALFVLENECEAMPALATDDDAHVLREDFDAHRAFHMERIEQFTLPPLGGDEPTPWMAIYSACATAAEQIAASTLENLCVADNPDDVEDIQLALMRIIERCDEQVFRDVVDQAWAACERNGKKFDNVHRALVGAFQTIFFDETGSAECLAPLFDGLMS